MNSSLVGVLEAFLEACHLVGVLESRFILMGVLIYSADLLP